MTDWGVHLMDIALWAKEVSGMPLSVAASGGNFAFPGHAHETFDTMSVLYQMPGYTMTWEHTAGIQSGPFGRSYGLAFIGDNGTLVIDRGSWNLFPEGTEGKTKIAAMPVQTGHDGHVDHLRDWLDCIRTRKEPACSIEKGRLAAVYCHMGNIALRTQSLLQWKEDSRDFGENRAANKLIRPQYRSPWMLPVI